VTDPRDRIYALLSLASDQEKLCIRPDYTLPLEKILKNVAARILVSVIGFGHCIMHSTVAQDIWSCQHGVPGSHGA
jgi:hypothetical protein